MLMLWSMMMEEEDFADVDGIALRFVDRKGRVIILILHERRINI